MLPGIKLGSVQLVRVRQLEASTIREEEMTIQEFELQVRLIEKEMLENLERRVQQEGDWGRAYLLKEIERWERFTD
jgi:hypothetical protein